MLPQQEETEIFDLVATHHTSLGRHLAGTYKGLADNMTSRDNPTSQIISEHNDSTRHLPLLLQSL